MSISTLILHPSFLPHLSLPPTLPADEEVKAAGAAGGKGLVAIQCVDPEPPTAAAATTRASGDVFPIVGGSDDDDSHSG